jgi:NAD(P)-dependent dehydrogenase (short-subunit alcohol dehydrogenase family)
MLGEPRFRLSHEDLIASGDGHEVAFVHRQVLRGISTTNRGTVPSFPPRHFSTPRRPRRLESPRPNALPVSTLPPREISNAVLYLASDEARYVTGAEFPVDAGNTIR